ncbi:hypothetical protein EDD86DRAFT_208503 [Gorgonomyces haynaldii]|nr:hypothetical protein EDD86DRAFT_208503 [Gorgonomyces haynaldii]
MSVGRLRLKEVVEAKLNKQYWLQGSNHVVFSNLLELSNFKDIVEKYNQLSQEDLDKVQPSKFRLFLERVNKSPFGSFDKPLHLKLVEFSKLPNVNDLIVQGFERVSDEHLPLAIQLAKQSDSEQVYIALLRLFGAKQRIREAEQLFQKLGTDEAKEVMVEVYCLNGQLEKAHELALKTDKSHLSLLKGHAARGEITLANKYFGLLKNSDLESQAYEHLIQVYSYRGLPGDCKQVYRKMRTKGLEVSSFGYEQLIRSHIADADITGANRWFYKKTIGYPSVGMYAALVEAYVSGKDIIGAYRTVKDCFHTYQGAVGIDKWTFIPKSVFEPLADQLQGKHTDYLVDRLNLSDFTGVKRSSVLTKLMQTVTDPKQKLEIYQIFENEGLRVPYVGYQTVIEAHGQLGNVDKGIQLFEDTIDGAFQNEHDAYVQMVAYLGKTKPTLVKEYVKRMTDKGHQLTPSVYEALLQSGERDLGLQEQAIIAGPEHTLLQKEIKYNLFA